MKNDAKGGVDYNRDNYRQKCIVFQIPYLREYKPRFFYFPRIRNEASMIFIGRDRLFKQERCLFFSLGVCAKNRFRHNLFVVICRNEHRFKRVYSQEMMSRITLFIKIEKCG